MQRICFLASVGLLVGATFAATGCAGVEDGSSPDEEIARERRFVDGGWTTLWTLGGGEGDTTLLQPRLMVPAASGGLYVWDDGRSAVLAFDAGGRWIWSAGKKGGGPEEFQRVRDMERDADGNLWVLDPGNSRLSVLSPDGRFIRRVPLAAVGHAEQVVPLSGGRAVLLGMSDAEPFVLIDSLGNAQRRFGTGDAEVTELHPMVRQGQMTSSGSDRWVYTLTLGDRWFAFDGSGQASAARRFVEHGPFPRVRTVREGDTETTEFESYPVCSACSSSLADSLLYVHFGGRTDHNKRLVDIYHVPDGAYRGTILLPSPVAEVAAAGDRVVTLQKDSATVITALRFSPK